MIEKHYYIAESERAERVKTEGRALNNARSLRNKEIAEKHAAYSTYGHRECEPHALVFEGDMGDEKKVGLKLETRLQQDGVLYTIFTPHKGTKVGKQIAADLAYVGEFSFSDYACEEFGVNHSFCGAHSGSRTGLAMYFSTAGIYKDKLVFCIPMGSDASEQVTTPPDMRRIKKSEFIALTEEDGEAEK